MLTKTCRSPTSSRPCSTSPAKCSAPTHRYACVRPTSPSPSLRPRWIYPATSAEAKAAPSARAQAGSRFSAAAWSTPTCSKPAASTPRCTPASHSAWAWNASPTSNIASKTCACSPRTTSASSRNSPQHTDTKYKV